MDSNVTPEQIADYLNAIDLPFRRQDKAEATLFLVPILTPRGTGVVGHFRLLPRRGVLTLCAPALLTTPTETRAAVSQLASHINYGLLTGRFAVDARDGELEWELPVLFAAPGLCQELVVRALVLTGTTVDEHLDAFRRVALGAWSVEQALAALAEDGGQPASSSPTQVLRRLLAELEVQDGADDDPGERRSA